MATATLIRTDEELQKDVLAELKWDAQVQPNEIGVAVKDGVVTLTGWVDSYLKKWAAEDAAHRVSGVRAVANEIEVKLATERNRCRHRSGRGSCTGMGLFSTRRQDQGHSFQRVGLRSGARWNGSTRRKTRNASYAGCQGSRK